MTREEIEKVFDATFDSVYGYVAFRVAPDWHAAEDITQDVFVAALNGLPKYRGAVKQILPWLKGIARNKVADHFRKRQALLESTSGKPERSASCEKDGSSENEVTALMVSTAMQQLPNTHVELLEEKYFDGLSVREIARRRKMSEKAVESALSRARSSFREAFRGVQQRRESK